jgi:alpha-L-rhamnosidase
VTVAGLRCEYLTNPLGIDVPTPRLSWILRAETRVQKQTAYRVLVASLETKLSADEGDLWDSGKVMSNETTQIRYAGTALQTRWRCFWKVRAWDQDGDSSAWSETARWTMGMLKDSDWQAKWIAAPGEPSGTSPIRPHNGYHTDVAGSPDTTKWVTIDLGELEEIDAVRLFPARPYDFSPDTPGYLFPVRFKIEAAQKPDWSDAEVVVDRTDADGTNPGIDTPVYRFPRTAARYVRLTATRLGCRDGSRYGFALAEIQVLCREKNVARGAKVTALDSMESDSWSTNNLADGRIAPEPFGRHNPTQSATMFRKEFEVREGIRYAMVSVTGLGLYELRINGQKVGDHLLAPEWTRYSARIQYQTYDVTDMLHVGRNAVGAQVAGGWWTGPLMFLTPPPDAQACLLMRMDIALTDGRSFSLITDSSWQASTDGPIRKTGIYYGEEYDATKEMPGWDRPGFRATDWHPVVVLPFPDGSRQAILVSQRNEPIRVMKELKPVTIAEPVAATYVFDMGQNMAGWCRLKAKAATGVKITVRHAEMLNADGTIYTANLRTAAQVNEYTCHGDEAAFEPHFTYHGFRYVEVTGLPNPPTEDTVLGRVFHSAAREAGEFACSNDLINRIMHAVAWTLRGNLHGVPTDCPQRDERGGWMGDIQVFSQTAIFQFDMAAFFTKWVQDIRDSQADDGRYPDLAPHVGDPNTRLSGMPGWGDAGTVVPWRMYQNYADTQIVEQHFDSAVRWVEFIRANDPDLVWRKNRGADCGDWLNCDAPLPLEGYPHGASAVPKDVFATAFFAHSTEIVAKMAHVLKRDEIAARYAGLFKDIKAAFNKAYVTSDGRIQGNTQAGYALALSFDLLDASLRPKAVDHLLEAIQEFKGHPSTGIQSTHRMMLELTRNGRHDEAWRLINLRTVPSWGYMIERGATTMWECWDGYREGRGFHDPVTTSFNHWALGAVGEWVWRELAGINLDEDQPGYGHFTIRPRPCGDLSWVKARYDSIRGRIVSDWEKRGGLFTLHVEVPVNTTATVYVPAEDARTVTEGATSVESAVGVKYIGMDKGNVVLFVESGEFRFRAPAAN